MAGRKEREAIGAAASADLHESCREVLRLLADDYDDEALDLAGKVADENPLSALAFNTMGRVCAENAESMADPGIKLSLLQKAATAYGMAAALAPKCIPTLICQAKATASLEQHKEAHELLKRALAIKEPSDPAAYDIRVHDLERMRELTCEGRKAEALVWATAEMDMLINSVNQRVRDQAEVLVLQHRKGGDEAKAARVAANKLEKHHPFSVRACLLPLYFLRESVRYQYDKDDRARGIMQYALRKMEDLKDKFQSSLIISLIYSEMTLELHKIDKAKKECVRGLKMKLPTDPLDEDLPPGEFLGQEAESRVQSVKTRLDLLLKQIQLLSVMSKPEPSQQNIGVQPVDIKSDMEVSIPESSQQGTRVQLVHGKSNMEEDVEGMMSGLMLDYPANARTEEPKGMIRQSLMYTSLPKPPRMEAPRPEQVLENGEVVDVEIVNQFAKYCQLAEGCSKKKTLCHMCVFGSMIFQHRVLRGSMIHHCSDMHTIGITCGEKGCEVMVRNARELILHKHFCHQLPPDWWHRWERVT